MAAPEEGNQRGNGCQRGHDGPPLNLGEQLERKSVVRLPAPEITRPRTGHRFIELFQRPWVGIEAKQAEAQELLDEVGGRAGELLLGIGAQRGQDQRHLFVIDLASFLVACALVGSVLIPEKRVRIVGELAQMVADGPMQLGAVLVEVPASGTVGDDTRH